MTLKQFHSAVFLFLSLFSTVEESEILHQNINSRQKEPEMVELSSDEVDFLPTRGPTSAVTSSSTDSSTDSSSFHANIIRLDPGRDFVVHGRQTPVLIQNDERVDKGLVIGEATPLQSKFMPVAITGETNLAKQKQDDDFISKVLDGFEMPSEDNVAISVHVEEVSTLQSSTSTRCAIDWLNGLPFVISSLI